MLEGPCYNAFKITEKGDQTVKRRLSVILLSLAIALPVMAQDTEEVPTIDQILDKYVQAIGGKAAVEKLTTRMMKGSLETPEGTGGSTEFYAKAPSKYVEMSNFPDYGIIQEGFDGTLGWSKNPESSARELSSAESAVNNREKNLHRDIRLKELYPKMTLRGTQRVGNRQAYLIEAVPLEGNPEKMYFDTQTGLLLRRELERVTMEEGIVLLEIFLDDYREVDGVKLPFTIRRSTPDYSYALKFSEIRHNIPIEDARFHKPTTP
jgi:zinc protease